MRLLATVAAALGLTTALLYKKLGARRAVLLASLSLLIYYASLIAV